MKIGLFSSSYPGVTGEGGIGTYTRNLAHALAALGHAVHVLTPGDARSTVEDGPVSVHLCRDDYFPVADRLVPGAGASYRVGTAMARLGKQHGLDIVEFPNWGGVGLWYAAQRPAPLVVRLYTSAAESNLIDGVANRWNAAWDVRRERWLSRTADALVTHSDAHRRQMAEELGIDAARIALIPLGIPLGDAFERPENRSGELTVVYLGRMEKRKGTLDLFHAAPEVLRAVPEARFILIGADRFDRLRMNTGVRAFLDGAGPAAIGAIVGSALPLTLALSEGWQYVLLGFAAVALFALRRGVVFTLVAAGAIGAGLALAGTALPVSSLEGSQLLLHLNDLLLLFGDDLGGERLELRVGALLELGLGHRDRPLVVRQHHLEEGRVERARRLERGGVAVHAHHVPWDA